ncbi:MAG: chemoreceptor glutamine deamidase CheD [Geminicoccaceae bacterium]
MQDKALFRHRGSHDVSDDENGSKQFFDPRFGTNVTMVLPGRHYVSTSSDEMIVTLLGSCIAACVRDPIAAVGGLNHFLLPESDNGQWGKTADAAMRYGNHAMETLINDIIKLGGLRSRLEVKVFGGSQIIKGASATSVGQKNVEFIKRYLSNEGLPIAAEHLGGTLPRRIHYFPITGRVQMRLMQRSTDKDLFKKEMVYRSEIKIEDDSGDAELFD